MLIVVVVALLGLAYGQQYPCCTVKQWEMGEYFQLGTVQSGKGSYIEGYSFLAYDQDKQMINALTWETSAGVTRHFRILQDYVKKEAYTINEQGNCTKTSITTPFIPPCVPVGSKLMGTLEFGSPDKPLVASLYDISKTTSGQNGFLTVTEDDCTPVMENLDGSVGDILDMAFKGYSNFTRGIKDPSVFDVPPQCESAPLEHLTPDPIDLYRKSVFY